MLVDDKENFETMELIKEELDIEDAKVKLEVTHKEEEKIKG